MRNQNSTTKIGQGSPAEDFKSSATMVVPIRAELDETLDARPRGDPPTAEEQAQAPPTPANEADGPRSAGEKQTTEGAKVIIRYVNQEEWHTLIPVATLEDRARLVSINNWTCRTGPALVGAGFSLAAEVAAEHQHDLMNYAAWFFGFGLMAAFGLFLIALNVQQANLAETPIRRLLANIRKTRSPH
jgi:hypothetical protein